TDEFGMPHGPVPERNLAEAISALNPISAPFIRAGVLGTNAEWQPVWLPAQMEAEGVLAIILQRLLPGSADFQAWCREEESRAATDVSLGIYAVDPNARRRNIDRIIHIGACVDREASSEHRTVTWSRTDGEDQRIGLQESNPDGIQTLIENAK